MKQNSGGTCRTTLLLFLVFVVLISSSTARNLITKPTESVLSEVGVKYIEGIDGHAASSTDQSIDFSDLLGSEREECEEKDEDCVKRRMVAEAHLDYIYTQHHKQP